MAKFYGIGVGPGDSELVTVKASRLLEDLDILYTPEAKKGSKSFALGIAEPYLKEHLEIKQRHFPMVRSNSTKEVQCRLCHIGRPHGLQHLQLSAGSVGKGNRLSDHPWYHLFLQHGF